MPFGLMSLCCQHVRTPRTVFHILSAQLGAVFDELGSTALALPAQAATHAAEVQSVEPLGSALVWLSRTGVRFCRRFTTCLICDGYMWAESGQSWPSKPVVALVYMNLASNAV